jgi:hypothetical protein
MPASALPLITLITDFGLEDHYVGVMKGVMLGINPGLRLVDICHQIHSHSVLEAAYTLEAAYPYFPAGTIHLIVVDPGVGSNRRPILAQCGDYYFIAPDNGVLSLVWQREKDTTVIELTSSRYFLPEVSATFHGRDIFAPVAAWLSRGITPQRLGRVIQDYLTLDLPTPKFLGSRILSGQIVRLDKFGNLISNITTELFEQARKMWGDKNINLYLGEIKINRLVRYYAEGEENEPCALFGSSGRLEVAVREQRADKLLGMGVGQELRLVFER